MVSSMIKDTSSDISPSDDRDSVPDEATDPGGSASSRTVEIMVYAVGLILAMIIAWYHDPSMVF